MRANHYTKTAKIFVALLLFLSGVSIDAQSTVVIQKGDRKFIGKNIEFLIDSTNKLTIEEVQKLKFSEGTTDILNLGGVTNEVWMRFNLQTDQDEIYMEINAPLINKLEIFDVNGGEVKSIFKGGSSLPYKVRPISMEKWLMSLDFKTNKEKSIYIKGQSFYPYQIPVLISAKDRFVEESKYHYLFWGIYMGVMILAFVYNFFIYLSVKEKSYLYYLLSILFSATFYLGLSGFGFWFFWPNSPIINPMTPILVTFSNLVGIQFAFEFLQIDKTHKKTYYFGIILSGLLIFGSVLNVFKQYEIALPLSQLLSLVVCFYLIFLGTVAYKNGVSTAKYYLLAWALFLILVVVYILTLNNVIPSNFFTNHSAFIGHMMEVSLLSFALADRINTLKRENESKQLKIIDGLKENEKLQMSLNQELEQKVKERTLELEQALSHLKSTQTQLIHTEKMASLGELTAGIAHEIQNPLNFVNNFADINMELIDEMVEEIGKGNLDEVKNLSGLIKDNEDKILHHGKRADSIVKGMLQHSRNSNSERESVDINQLCDEYLKLAFLGYKAKDKSFKATYQTSFDYTIPKINIVRQDVGRVILNIINNAFYAVVHKDNSENENYDPKVSVKTSLLNNKVKIEIEDNGEGIPNSIKEKIFQPFFTTKPTGQGTGLGLSLAFDIIKAHNGTIEVDSTTGVGTKFTILIPINNN